MNFRIMKYFLILPFLVGFDSADGNWVNDLSDILSRDGLSEGTDVGTPIGNLQYNSTEPVVYSTNSTYFEVQSRTGVVTLKMQLVYLRFKSLMVEFIAKFARGGSQEFRRTVTVKINPINHAPSFDFDHYRTSVTNNVAIGSLIYNSILVTDSDEGTNGTVSIECDRTASANASQICDFFTVRAERFQNSSHRAFVTLAKTLDSNQATYILPLKATDGGIQPLTASAELQIDLVLDSRPVILDTPIITQINEFAPLSSILVTVRIRDERMAATGNTLAFDITDDGKGWFRVGTPIQNAEGLYSVPILVAQNIQLVQNNMIQRYIFTFRASQLVNGQSNQVVSYASIVVTIMDINDNAPTFNQSNYIATVSEGLSNGATIAGLSIFVYDNDLGDNAYFELEVVSSPSPIPDIFGLVPTSGQGMAAVAVVVNRPDYVRVDNFLPRNYSLKITAKETRTAELRSSSTFVRIQVVSLINHPPYFRDILNPIVVYDNAPVGSIISTYIKADDDDPGPNGTLSYSLGNDSIANTYFSINNQTGVLTLKSSLNFTIQSSFIFNVIATDGGGLTTTLAIRVNVFDSRKIGPQFSQNFYSANVTELMIDLFPQINIKATLEPMRNDRVMRYELLTVLMPQIFSIDPNNGSLKMLQGVDYKDTPNKQGYFDLDVQASVVGYPEILPTKVTCRIYILDTNNHAPYFVPPNQTLSRTIKDNTPSSTSLFHLNATDDDVGINAQIDYFIQSGARSNFVIESFTGILSVSNNPRLMPNTTYNITVIAIDRGQPPLTGTTTVYITIIDSISRNPTFLFSEYVFYVIEGSVSGLLVGTAKAASMDRRAVISYSFVQDSWKAFNYSDNIVNTNVRNWFSVDSSTAEIKVLGTVVFSQARKVTFMLSANVTNRDPDVTSDLATVVLVTINILPKGENSDVVRLSPSTDFIYIQIYEQQQVNTIIFQFNAFYYATSRPVNNYTFSNQSANGDYLTLERTTGLLQIAKLIRYLDVAPNTNITYYLVAKAPLPSQAQAGATVVVNILPLSGNYPIFNQSTYDFTIYSNDLPGKFIGQIFALKPPMNDPVRYALVGFSNEFQVTQNGSIILLSKINDLSSPRLLYVLLVSASLTNFSTSRAEVNIKVMPVKERGPQFTSLPYNFVVQMNSTGYVGQVLAYDPDRFNSTPIKYAIVSITPTTNIFIINQTTGVIWLTGDPPNYNYTLNVSATDTSSTPLTNYSTVDIHVYKSSLDKPIFSNISNTYSIYNLPNLIVKVSGTSAVPNRQLTYYVDTQMIDSSAGQYFYMDRSTGELRFVGAMPGSESKNYSLILILSDGVSNATKEIVVGVYRDDPPTFNCKSNLIEVNVLDYTPAVTRLTNSIGITTNTPCSYNKPGTAFYYAIVGSNLTSQPISNIFDIINNTGQLVSKMQLNAYLLDKTLINVRVAANANDLNLAQNRPGATGNIILTFTGQAIRSPIFNTSDLYCPGTGLFLQTGVMDLSSINTPVTRVQAGSCNMPGFNGVTYSIQRNEFKYYANNPAAAEGISPPDGSNYVFDIDQMSGQVYTRVEDLRPFYNGWFKSTITASTQGNPALKTATTLIVYILREFQYLRVVFNKDVATARNNSSSFVNAVNNRLGSNYQMVPSLTTTYIDRNGARNFSLSYMCYFLLKRDPSSGDYYVTSDLIEVMNLINTTQLSQSYGSLELYDHCYSNSKQSTKWWSDKWFLWFILIAFSILVFVVALILTCCVCFYWPMNLKEISKARPYVVFGDPGMSAAGSIADERW